MQRVYTKNIQAIVLDLSEVVMSGLLGAEVLVSKELRIPATVAYDALHPLMLTDLMCGRVSEDVYLENCSKVFDSKISPQKIGKLIRQNMSPYDYTTSMINLIHARKLKVGLLSNHVKEWVSFCKTLINFENAFDVEVYSFEVGACKPDPEMYERVVQKLGVKSCECVMIDDSEENVLSAERLGMEGIHFRSYPEFVRRWNSL